MVVIWMANPLAKSILNNIAKRELKTTSESREGSIINRLSGREEELLTSLLKRNNSISYKKETLTPKTTSTKPMTLESLAERVKGRER